MIAVTARGADGELLTVTAEEAAEVTRWLGDDVVLAEEFRPAWVLAAGHDRALEPHSSHYALEHWAGAHGWTVGSAQAGAPTGMVAVPMYGTHVPKWRNLTEDDRRALDGLVLWSGPRQLQTGRLFVRARVAHLAHP